MLNFLWIISAGHVHQVRGEFRNRSIIAEFLYLRDVIFHPHKFNITVFDLARAIPYIHHHEKAAAHDQGYKTTMGKFVKIRKKETQFKRKINCQVQVDKYGCCSSCYQVIGK